MRDWLDTTGFTPHGFCLSWDSDLISVVVLANGLIAFAYLIITAVLTKAAFGPKPAMPRWFLLSFTAFVFCCGVSHVMDDLTLWFPLYRLQAVVLTITAAVSLFAALLPISIWLTREAAKRLPRHHR